MADTPEMVRRVAHTLFRILGPADSNSSAADYDDIANAVIETMREPPGYVTNAGWDAMMQADQERKDGRELIIWHAMIDAALDSPDHLKAAVETLD